MNYYDHFLEFQWVDSETYSGVTNTAQLNDYLSSHPYCHVVRWQAINGRNRRGETVETLFVQVKAQNKRDF